MTTEAYFPRFQLVDVAGNVINIATLEDGTTAGGASEARQLQILAALDALLIELRKKTDRIDNQTINGEVFASQQGEWIVRLSESPAIVSIESGTVEVANFPQLQQIQGTVEVANFPQLQQIQGTVEVSNLVSTPFQTYKDFGSSAATVVKGSPGSVFAISCYNMRDCVRYFQLFDQATTPQTGDIPIESHPVSGNNLLIMDTAFFGALGRTFLNGIAWGLSTNPFDFSRAPAIEQITHLKYL